MPFRASIRAAAAVSLLATSAGIIPAADWPTHRGNSGRTGFTEATLTTALHPVWHHSLPAPQPAWSPPARRSYWQRLEQLAARVADDHVSVPVIAGDVVLCGSSSDDQLRCFDAASGNLRWSFQADGPIRYAPAVAGTLAVFGSDDGWIYAVRTVDGSLAWRHHPGPSDRRIPGNGPVISAWPIRSGILVDRGTVFATAGLYPQQGAFALALDAADGSIQWRQSLDVSPEGYILGTDRLVILPTGRASPLGLDRDTGKVIRTFDTDGGTFAVASEGEIIGGPGNDGTLTGVATESGQRLVTARGRNLVAAGPQLHLLEAGRLKTIDRVRQSRLQRRIRELETRVRSSQARPPAAAGTPAESARRAELQSLGGELNSTRRDLDACELWTVSCPEDLSLIAAGDVLIAGGTQRVALFDRASGRRLWEAPVEGRALALAAARDLLIVATDLGHLHAFAPASTARPGPLPTSAPAKLASPQPSQASVPHSPSAARRVDQLLAAGLAHRGYALVAGLGSGQLIEELLARTELHIVGIDSISRNVTQARNVWIQRGLYGSRIRLHTLPAGQLPFTDFFANLVLSESALEGTPLDAWSDAELTRVTRPFGGVRWTQADAPPTARGRLDGAGQWTHQFANPGNTASSGDQRIQSQLDLQWFGGPGPDLMVDRHLRGPAPLAAQGRLFVPGENQLIAVDAYNGTLLWQRDLPDSQRYTMPYDAGYMSLDGSRLAVAVRDACWLLDTADGRVQHQWPAPPSGHPSDTNAPHWGYVALVGQHLYGTTQKPTASRTLPGYEQIDVDYNNDQPLVTGSSLFQMDAPSGKTLWHRRGGVLINTTLTLSESRIFLVESREPRLHRHPTGRIPLTTLLQGDPWIVAIDTADGRTLWERRLTDDVAQSRNILYLSTDTNHLVLIGSRVDHSTDTRYSVECRNPSDGGLRWTGSHPAGLPGAFTHGEQVHHPVILGDLLVAEPAVYDLATGKRRMDAGGISPWNLIRPGHSCGTLSAAGDCVFFRAGNPTVLDIRANLRSHAPPIKLSPSRTGCWINMIPANGLLLIPEASAGCVCQFSLQTSMGFLPRSP